MVRSDDDVGGCVASVGIGDDVADCEDGGLSMQLLLLCIML